MSLELGYLKTSQLAVSHALSSAPPDATSFLAFCDRFAEEATAHELMDLCHITDDESPRLQLHIGTDVARAVSDRFLLADVLFADDWVQIADACYETYSSPSALSSLKISTNVTMWDLIKISRILKFYGTLRLRTLQRLENDDYPTYIRSVLGGANANYLQMTLNLHGIKREVVSEFLEMVTWRPMSGIHLDLQYTPFIQVGDTLTMLYSCHLHSNLIRNAMMRSKIRPNADGVNDYVSEDIANALRPRARCVCTRLKYTHKGEAGEVDVLAIIGKTLFVFECKNTLLPCSFFEQRAFFDHMDKGADQLDKFHHAWQQSDEFRGQISDKLKIDPRNVQRVVTGIIPTVRLLSGAHYRGHPVRHARELANFVNTGRGRCQTDHVYEFDVWHGKEFSESLLVEYFADNTNIYASVWQSATKEVVGFSCRRWKIELTRFGFSPELFLRALRDAGANPIEVPPSTP